MNIAFIGILLILLGSTNFSKAQTIELLAGNTLNGAMNGVLLGGATMALQNSNDYDPVRVGVGLGTLYGIGVGVYDISTVTIGNQFYASGAFNDGTNSTIIVLLDTFYGAAAGAVVSTSISLIANKPILEGLQYGTGAGAWIGFGFGVIDSFTLAKRHHTSQIQNTSTDQTTGLIRLSFPDKDIALGLLYPSIYSQKEVSNRNIGIRQAVGVDVLNFSLRF